jgi:anti-anti-sigma regulatory factor
MNFKIDTKEKFYVIEPEVTQLTANMAEQLCDKVQSLSQNEPFNVIVKLNNIATIDENAAQQLAECRIAVHNSNHSFVACQLQKPVLEQIVAWELDEAINITPTESEAWDIVQMDEIEREFMAGEDEPI